VIFFSICAPADKVIKGACIPIDATGYINKKNKKKAATKHAITRTATIEAMIKPDSTSVKVFKAAVLFVLII
jgi:hypothetical protein